jgi:predicted RNA-binding protein with EMAP domain
MTLCPCPDYDHEQTPAEEIDYFSNFVRRLADGEGIASVTAAVVAGEGVVGSGAHAPSFDGTVAKAYLSAVEIGADVVLQIVIVTDATPPRTLSDEHTIRPVVKHTG